MRSVALGKNTKYKTNYRKMKYLPEGFVGFRWCPYVRKLMAFLRVWPMKTKEPKSKEIYRYSLLSSGKEKRRRGG